MSNPYREPGAVVEQATTYPRVLLGDAKQRLIQVSEREFLIEHNQTYVDGLGVKSQQWVMIALLSAEEINEAKRCRGALVRYPEECLWLCEQIAKARS